MHVIDKCPPKAVLPQPLGVINPIARSNWSKIPRKSLYQGDVLFVIDGELYNWVDILQRRVFFSNLKQHMFVEHLIDGAIGGDCLHSHPKSAEYDWPNGCFEFRSWERIMNLSSEENPPRCSFGVLVRGMTSSSGNVCEMTRRCWNENCVWGT